tara:strand:+ start:464 stop:1417 length:954 start_codon:yes stop_codon:yes gene_type:complete
MAIITGTLLTAGRFAAPHIARIGARRLTLMMAKQATKQAIKKGATKVAGNQLIRGAKLKGIQGSRALQRSLAKAGKEREIGRILNKTNLPKRPPGKNLLETSKNIKGKVQGQNPFKLEPIKRGRLLGKEGAKYKDLNWLGKQKYDLATGRVKGGALGRNALRVGASQKLFEEGVKRTGNIITGGETGKKVKALKAQRKQEKEAQALMESLSEQEKLAVEQELELLASEKVAIGQDPTTSLTDIKTAVTKHAGTEYVDTSVKRKMPKTEIPTMTDDGGRAEWLARTANSPAAKAGFSDDERWALQLQHREWQANRRRR